MRTLAERARVTRARANLALVRHGAMAEDLGAYANGGAVSDRLRGAVLSFCDTLTPEQWQAIVPATRNGTTSLHDVRNAILDLWEGLATVGDRVMMRAEFVEIAEKVWPEEQR